MLETWRRAVSLVVCERRYLLLWAIAGAAFFALYVFLPVLLIPGNSLEFQLSLVPPESFALFVVFALLSGLLVSLQVYAWRHPVARASGVALGTGSSLVGLVGAGVKGPLCASCIASIAGLVGLGLPAVVFVLQHRNEITLGALALILVSLHFSVKRMNAAQACLDCCLVEAK